MDQIATTSKLGHIKPDGETIKVDPVTGVASAKGNGVIGEVFELVSTDGINYTLNTNKIIDYTVGLRLLVSSSSINKATNLTLKINDLSAKSLVRATGEPIRPSQFGGNKGVYEVIYNGTYFNMMGDGFGLIDSVNSSSTTLAATTNVVKQVNDKLIGDNVAIGKEATANLAGTGNIALGLNASATNGSSVAIGYSANSLNNYGFVLGIANHNVTVPGKFSVSGTKILKYLTHILIRDIHMLYVMEQ